MVLAFLQVSLFQILSRSYISAMYLFICFFVTDFVHRMMKLLCIPELPAVSVRLALSHHAGTLAYPWMRSPCQNFGLFCQTRRNPSTENTTWLWEHNYSFPKPTLFLHVCSASLLKTLCETEKLLVTSNFSFSNSVFCLFGELSAIFIKFEIVICKLFQIGRI